MVPTWADAGKIPLTNRAFRVKMNTIRDPANTFAVIEFRGFANDQGAGRGASVAWSAAAFTQGSGHRSGRYNCLFRDGHVQGVTEKETLGTGTPAAPRGMWTIAVGD